VLILIPLVIGVTFIVFFLTALIPGDVVDVLMEQEYDPETAMRLREILGLDQPFFVRYWRWISRLAQGDLGVSKLHGFPHSSEIIEKYPPTLELALLSTVIGVLIGIPFGVLSATKQFHVTDDFLRLSSLIGFSVPSFWIATMSLLVVSVYFPGFPILTYVPFSEDPIRNLTIMSLPALTLGIHMSAVFVRMTRACVLEVIRQQFVVTARSKGVGEGKVLFKHVLRNAMIPVVTLAGLRFGHLIGGLVITEEIFGIPGLGRLVISSISTRDWTLLLGLIVFISLGFMLINLLVDILYAFIDPRISYRTRRT
jgi:peptide/nickel transport system permease protein